MLDLKQLTADVCCIANAIGSFLREERKHFRSEYVVEKCTHDYVSYVDKESEKKLITHFRLCFLRRDLLLKKGRLLTMMNPIAG